MCPLTCLRALQRQLEHALQSTLVSKACTGAYWSLFRWAELRRFLTNSHDILQTPPADEKDLEYRRSWVKDVGLVFANFAGDSKKGFPCSAHGLSLAADMANRLVNAGAPVLAIELANTGSLYNGFLAASILAGLSRTPEGLPALLHYKSYDSVAALSFADVNLRCVKLRAPGRIDCVRPRCAIPHQAPCDDCSP
jgi:hypothetical protein